MVDTFANRNAKYIGTIVSCDAEEKIGGRIFRNQTAEFKFENVPDQVKNSVDLISDIDKFFERNNSSEVRSYKIGENVY